MLVSARNEDPCNNCPPTGNPLTRVKKTSSGPPRKVLPMYPVCNPKKNASPIAYHGRDVVWGDLPFRLFGSVLPGLATCFACDITSTPERASAFAASSKPNPTNPAAPRKGLDSSLANAPARRPADGTR